MLWVLQQAQKSTLPPPYLSEAETHDDAIFNPSDLPRISSDAYIFGSVLFRDSCWKEEIFEQNLP